MSTLNIQIGKDVIVGKSVEQNKWEFWLGSQKFTINSSDATQDAAEVYLSESTTLTGKQLHPNIWTAEHSYHASSGYGSIWCWYTLEFNTKLMTAVVTETVDASA